MKHPRDAEYYLPAEEFFQQNAPTGLTYDDISLATRYSEILPRQANLETRLSDSLTLQIPILSADMDTVTEAEMAVAMSLNGGIGIIHYNMENKRQVKQVARVSRPRRRLLPAGQRLIGLAVPKPSVAPSPAPSIHTPRNGDVAA